MTFLSTQQSQAVSVLKTKMSHKKVIISLLALTSISILGVLANSAAHASSCSKADIDYYLQRGFTNDQVVQLCSGSAQSNSQQTHTYQAPVQNQQSQQQNQIREDESYLSAALDANGVNLNNQNLTILPRECFVSSGSTSRASSDIAETLCVNTKLKINFAGMKIGKASKGLFLVSDAKIKIAGNIQRELIGLNQLRRQDRETVLENLSKTPKEVNVKIRRGIDPTAVAQRLKKYSK